MTKIIWKNSNGNYYVTENVDLGFKEDYLTINCAKSDKKYLDYLFASDHVEQSVKGNRDSNDANVRKNTIITRKRYLAALTDKKKIVKIVKKSSI